MLKMASCEKQRGMSTIRFQLKDALEWEEFLAPNTFENWKSKLLKNFETASLKIRNKKWMKNTYLKQTSKKRQGLKNRKVRITWDNEMFLFILILQYSQCLASRLPITLCATNK